jgi:hypothetical protein
MLSISGEKGYSILGTDQIDTNRVFIGEFELKKINKSKKNLVFTNFTKLTFPQFIVKSQTNYLFSMGKFIYPYYFFTYENLVGNVETGEYFPLIKDLSINHNYSQLLQDIPNLMENLDFCIHDIILSNDKLILLSKQKENILLQEISPKKWEILKTRELPLSNVKQGEVRISGWFVIDAKTIGCITSQNELVSIALID